jgi:hypothetical protein
MVEKIAVRISGRIQVDSATISASFSSGIL